MITKVLKQAGIAMGIGALVAGLAILIEFDPAAIDDWTTWLAFLVGAMVRGAAAAGMAFYAARKV